jgi:MFS family permease
MLGYESVYAIVLPIALTEILFPNRRNTPWLDKRGIIVAIVVFLIGALGVWWLWSHVGVRRYGSTDYHIPYLTIGLALLVIFLLVAIALLLPARVHPPRHTTRHAWSPWLLGFITFIFGLFWWLLVAFAYIPASTFHGLSPIAPIFIGLLWALLALLLIRHLSQANNWQDRHRLALIIGAVLASMLGGSFSILAAAPIDKTGKLVFDLIALALLIRLAWHLHKSHHPSIP